jgi:hypothetical protein
VLNDHDRVAAPSPRGNQLGDVLLGMGIVAGPSAGSSKPR